MAATHMLQISAAGARTAYYKQLILRSIAVNDFAVICDVTDC
jgi:hypothetical protein